MHRCAVLSLQILGCLKSVIAVSLLTIGAASANDKDDQRGLEREVAEAKNGTQLQIAVRRFLDVPGNVDRSQSLRSHTNDTLALCGAWELVRESVPAERKGRINNLRRPSVTSVERFLGFTEGRLRLAIPSWWEDRILGATTDGGALWMTPHHDVGPYQPIPCPEDLWPKGKDRLLSITRYFVVYTENGAPMLRTTINRPKDAERDTTGANQNENRPLTCKLPDGIVDKIRNDVSTALTCYMDDRYCLLATGSVMLAGPYDLYCIDRQEERTVWKETVWTGGTVNLTIQGPGNHHAASIQLSQGRVLIFGAGALGAYFESFSLKDGRPLGRFSTSY